MRCEPSVAKRDPSYRTSAPDPAAVRAQRGLLLIDFGTDWCGHCSTTRAVVDAWCQTRPSLDHLRVEDGRGRPLGRAFAVRLWPTLVLLRDGHEIARVVRPREARDLWPLELVLD